MKNFTALLQVFFSFCPEHSTVVLRPNSILARDETLFFSQYGGSFLIPCRVRRNDGTSIRYDWYFESHPVVSGAHVTDLGNGSLQLESVTALQRGEYECRVQLSVSGLGDVELTEVVGVVTVGVGGE